MSARTALRSTLLETLIGVTVCLAHAATHHCLVDRTDKRGLPHRMVLRTADQECYWYCKEQNAFLEISFN
jgi:transketolase C-terminal domain/subunit